MDLALSSEQLDLRSGLSRFLAAECPPAALRQPAGCAAHRELWTHLSELGAMEVVADGEPTEDSFGLVTAMLVAEELGYAAFPGPWIEHAVVAASTLAGARRDVDQLLDPGSVVTTALPGQGGLPWPSMADAVLLGQPEGSALQLVLRKDIDGCEAAAALDPSRPVMTCPRLRSGGAAQVVFTADVGRLVDLGSMAAAAQLVGLGRRMLDITVPYVLQRKQFGRQIGSFQAVQHLLADARTALEYARPLPYVAAASAEANLSRFPIRAAIAKAKASAAAETIARACLQCHGAMGYSEEYDLQLYMRRAWALARSWRSTSEARARVADLLRKESGDYA
ncbi:MAG: acyl-CoA dehydrogenase [Mycobacterium sp.]|uniref:acyl-CoA dehydrogenase family protein n=1 Tax=Mycobacterium sp. TaxID=1785 RepID=UPI003C3EB147